VCVYSLDKKSDGPAGRCIKFDDTCFRLRTYHSVTNGRTEMV